jgi:hypothetical protein
MGGAGSIAAVYAMQRVGNPGPRLIRLYHATEGPQPKTGTKFAQDAYPPLLPADPFRCNGGSKPKSTWSPSALLRWWACDLDDGGCERALDPHHRRLIDAVLGRSPANA